MQSDRLFLETFLKRRNFIKALGAGLLGVPGLSCRSSILDIDPWWREPTMGGPFASQGTVLDGSGPLGGVAVSDGLSVTRTDADGRFQLLAPDRPDFVTVCVPSGHTIAEGGQFYARFPADADEAEFSFRVNRRPVSDVEHEVLLLADPQLELSTDADSFAADDFLGLIDAGGGTDRVRLVVSLGDLIFDRPLLLPMYTARVGSLGGLALQVIGNHDRDPQQPVGRAKRLFSDRFGPTYYSFDIGEVHYVVLDTVHFVEGGFRPVVAAPQLWWLEQDLALLEPGRTVVVLTHVPLSWLEAESAQALRYILSRHVAHYFAGHTHTNFHHVGARLSEHVVGTVCGPWWAGPVCEDGTPRGYAVLNVSGDDVSWTYRSLGFGPTYQMRARLFPGGPPSEMFVNVWDWDSRWRILWWEDGRPRGTAQREPGYDPLAWDLYFGADVPVRRPLLEPGWTEHRFVLRPDRDWKRLQILAADPFGRSYLEVVDRQE